MSIKLQKNVPLDAKFGLHFGRFSELPTTEEFFRFQTLFPHLKHRLYALDIGPVIPLLQKDNTYQLAVEIPVLGFTDPALDYDVNPWFAIPLAINGYVAQAERQHLSRATVEVKDISGQVYPVFVDDIARIDFGQIAQTLQRPFFSTLCSIRYLYSASTILNGTDLAPLPKIEDYKNKIILCLPKAQMPFKIKLIVIHQHEERLKQELFISPIIEQTIKPEISTNWRGTALEGVLHIGYRAANHYALSQAQYGALHLSLPHKNKLKLMVNGSLAWISTTKDKTFTLTQHYGLSTAALAAILKQLIPFDHFYQRLQKGFSVKQEAIQEYMNRYDANVAAAGVLYQQLLSGVINRSVPLAGLEPYVKKRKNIYAVLNALNMNAWPLADQIVYKQYLCGLAIAPRGVDGLLDDLDRQLCFGLNALEGELQIHTSGVSLSKKPSVQARLDLFPLAQMYPLPELLVDSSQIQDESTRISVKKVKQPKRVQSLSTKQK